MYLNIEGHQKYENFTEKTSESAHPMTCLLFGSGDVIPGKQPNSLLSVDCRPIALVIIFCR